MARLATVTLALTLLAAATSAETFQERKPNADSAPAKVQGRAGNQRGGKATPVTARQKTDTKRVDTKKVDTKGVGTRKAVPANAQRRPGRTSESAGEAREKGAAGKRTADAKGPAPKLNRAEMTRKLTLEERKHRERVAKITRLRKLAEEKKQTARIAALDGLLEKENARYARWISHGRKVLGEKEFASVDARLRKGRRHPGQGAGPRIKTEKAGTPVKKDRDGKEHDGEKRDGKEHD